MKQTKKQKIRSWMKDHSFELTAGAIYVSMIVVVGYVAIKQSEAIAEELDKQEAWQRDQLEQGNTIIEKDDHLMAVKVVSVY